MSAIDAFLYSIIKEEGDFSLLQNVVGHSKQYNCEICQKHSPTTTSKEILRQIVISIGSQQDAPRIVEINLMGETLHPELNSREYVLQGEMINKRPSWRHTKLPYVIWYNNIDDRWMISHSKDIGTSNWIFAGQVGNNKWPNELIFKGEYVKNIEDSTEFLVRIHIWSNQLD